MRPMPNGVMVAIALTLPLAIAISDPGVGTSVAKPATDGAGKMPPIIRKPPEVSKLGTFNVTKLGELQARITFLAQQLNQSIIATERYAHTSTDHDVHARTHIRIAGVIAGLQKQWNKMSAAEVVPGMPSPTAAKAMASAAKMLPNLPKPGTPGSLVPAAAASKSTVQSTSSLVNRIAPGAKPPASVKPKIPSGASTATPPKPTTSSWFGRLLRS